MLREPARQYLIAFSLLALNATGCGDGSAKPPPPFYFIDHLNEAEATFNRKLFLSSRNDARLSLPITLEDESRLALAPPLPSRFAFGVRVPSNPILRFAIALNPIGDAKVFPRSNSDCWPKPTASASLSSRKASAATRRDVG